MFTINYALLISMEIIIKLRARTAMWVQKWIQIMFQIVNSILFVSWIMYDLYDIK